MALPKGKYKAPKRPSFAQRAIRQQGAIERQAERESRTPAQQLALIATRPGESKKEKARLLRLIEG